MSLIVIGAPKPPLILGVADTSTLHSFSFSISVSIIRSFKVASSPNVTKALR